jgi:hypothetical protein
MIVSACTEKNIGAEFTLKRFSQSNIELNITFIRRKTEIRMSYQTSVDREEFKTSSSFIDPFDLTFVLWKYKPERQTMSAVLKRGGAT